MKAIGACFWTDALHNKTHSNHGKTSLTEQPSTAILWRIWVARCVATTEVFGIAASLLPGTPPKLLPHQQCWIHPNDSLRLS